MLKILAIGNSFSEDATYYLHDLLTAAGVESRVVNMYIGGCSLERHWSNMESGEQAYEYQENGVKTDRFVSIDEMLLDDNWDYIVSQQSSHDSGWENTYEPFIGLFADYIRKKVPNAELVFQKTWAYDNDCGHGNFMRYHRNQEEMFERLNKNYTQICAKYNIRLIPCADAIQNLRKLECFDMSKGGMSLCRDGFHMHYIYGRFILAYTWARALLGKSLEDNSFVPKTDYLPDEETNLSLICTIRHSIEKTFS